MTELASALRTTFGQRMTGLVNVNPTFTLQILEHAQVARLLLHHMLILIQPMMEPANVRRTMLGPQKTENVSVRPTST
jgi:hypothetical protein